MLEQPRTKFLTKKLQQTSPNDGDWGTCMIVQVHLWDLGQWHCQNSALTLAIFCEHNLKKITHSHIIIWGSAITQRGKYALSQILKRGVSSQSGGKQIWNKYERNPTEKYSWVEIPNERKNFPKLEEDRKAAPQPQWSYIGLRWVVDLADLKWLLLA